MKKTILIALLLLISVLPAFAAEYLTSARGGGMGFSYFVIADDPSGAVYNAAGIGFTRGWQSYMMLNIQNDYEYLTQAEDPYNGRFAVVYPIRDLGTVAINTHQSGSLAKVTGIPTINHGAITFAREIAPGWSTGASFKYLYETMYGKRSAYDLDLGVIYRSSYGVIGAAAFENVLRSRLTPDYLGYQEHLARRERIGLGYIQSAQEWQALFAAAAQIEESGISQKYTTSLFNIGSEWWFLPDKNASFALRGGLTFGQGVRWDVKSDYSGYYAGFSVNLRTGVNDLRFDYSFSAYPYETNEGYNLGDHQLALSYGWGGVSDYSFKKDSYSYDDDPAPYRPEVSSKPQIYEPADDASGLDKDTDFDSQLYIKYDVMMDVADISAADFKRIVFYLRPQRILMTDNWTLYVFRAKIKNWSEEEIGRWALKVVKGRGVPPLNVVWDGISQDGTLLPPGKYYYILTAEDAGGSRYATKWHNFKLE